MLEHSNYSFSSGAFFVDSTITLSLYKWNPHNK